MRILVLLLSLITCSFLSAQKVDFNDHLAQGIDAAIELRYPDLEEILAKERELNPDNRMSDYLEAVSLVLQMFLVEDEAFFDERVSHLNRLIDKLDDLPDSDPNKRVLQAELILGRSGVYGKYKHNIKAAWGFYRAYNLLSENFELYPDHIPTLIPYGVLLTAVGSLPDDYRSIANLFGFEGDIQRGLKYIRKAYYYSLANPKYRFHRNYFGFVYAYVNFELETQEQVSLYTLGMKVESSAYFIYLEAQQKLRAGQAVEALSLLQKMPKGDAYLNIPYFTYYQAKVALMVNPELAKRYLDDFLEETKDNERKKSAYRYMAWYHLLKGEREAAEGYRQKILQEKESLTGADKQALAEARRGFNTHLIKARLDFDAGRYAQIVETLSPWLLAKACKKDWEKQEFHYRRARALQELGFGKEAQTEYQKAVSFSNTTYALGNSTLQLGLLAERQGAWATAREYLEKAASLEGYPFYEGVQQKAKTALSRQP